MDGHRFNGIPVILTPDNDPLFDLTLTTPPPIPGQAYSRDQWQNSAFLADPSSGVLYPADTQSLMDYLHSEEE
jgi:hypothetical protein